MRVKMFKQPPHEPTASAVGPCPSIIGGGRVVRWCWVNFQFRGVLHFFDNSRARAYCVGWLVVLGLTAL